MGKATQKQVVNEYHMSIHAGMCTAMDALTGIYVGQKQAWVGRVTDSTPFQVSAINLFGGPKKEGGVSGMCYFLPGGPDQVMPEELAQRRQLTSATHPAFRGLASLYFVGNTGLGSGFMWGATPYMQDIWMRGERRPVGLTDSYAMIGSQFTSTFTTTDVTVDGTTVTRPADGTSLTVDGHTVQFTNHGQTFTIDGTPVTITDGAIDGQGNAIDGITVQVNSSTGYIRVGDGITLDGLDVTVTGYTNVTVGSVTFKVFTASVNSGQAGPDANPAHIIYECLIDDMGAPESIIDITSFEAVGVKLFHEGFGVSLIWTKESAIEDFISELLDHIQAALYVDPETGKLTLSLFRDDYDADFLPLITPDNADLDNYQRKLWGETINEIVVTWTNPTNEQDETVTAQDLGNITIQGDPISDSRNYYAIRNAPLATRVCARDLRQSAAPLSSADARFDRTQWNLRPGSRVRLVWPKYNITDPVIMRVMSIDYGKAGTPEIAVSLLEDIFSLDRAATSDSPAGAFTGTASLPAPLDHARIISAPAFFTSRELSAADADTLTYPEVYAGILGATAQPDTFSYELMGQTVLPNGDTVAEDAGQRVAFAYGLTTVALPAEATSVVASFPSLVGAQGPVVSGFIFIGDEIEGVMEIALLESFDSVAGWTVQRGVLDTVPRAWPVGTAMWFYDVRNGLIGPDIHSQGESVSYKMLSNTSLGQLDVADAPIVGAVMTARPHLPNRPANVTVGGVAFGSVDLPSTTTPPTAVAVTWANRNRTMEDVSVFRWSDANVVPEVGQTTTIRVLDPSGVVLSTTSGLTGTGYSLPVSAFGAAIEGDVVLTSERDGLESLQGLAVRVRVVVDSSSIGDPTPPPTSDPYTPPTTYPPPQKPPSHGGGPVHEV